MGGRKVREANMFKEFFNQDIKMDTIGYLVNVLLWLLGGMVLYKWLFE